MGHGILVSMVYDGKAPNTTGPPSSLDLTIAAPLGNTFVIILLVYSGGITF